MSETGFYAIIETPMYDTNPVILSDDLNNCYDCYIYALNSNSISKYVIISNSANINSMKLNLTVFNNNFELLKFD